MADRYWINNGGNWSDTTHWSTATGGASGASVPDYEADIIYFDENSITTSGQTIIIDNIEDLDVLISSLDFTNILNNPTLQIDCPNLYIYGDFILKSGMNVVITYMYGLVIYLSGSGGSTIYTFDTANIPLSSSYIKFNEYINSYNIISDVIATGIEIHTPPIFSCNTITLIGTSANNPSWRSYVPDDLVLDLQMCNIILEGTMGYSIYFEDDGTSSLYNNITFKGGDSIIPTAIYIESYPNISSNISAGSIEFEEPSAVYFYGTNTVLYVTDFILNGTETIQSLIYADGLILSKEYGTITVTYTTIYGSTVTGGAVWRGTTGCLDAGGNNGWIVPPVPPLYWVGGEGNISDSNHWSDSSGGLGGSIVPTLATPVIFDENSGLVDNNTINIDSEFECKSLTSTTGVTYDLFSDLYYGGNATIFGSLTLEAGLTLSVQITLFGSDSTITSNGAYFTNILYIAGTYTLQDNLNVEYDLEITRGIFDANDYDITAQNIWIYTDSNDNITVYMGSGTWEIMGEDFGIRQFDGYTINLYAETSTIKFTAIADPSLIYFGFTNENDTLETGKTFNNIWFTGSNVDQVNIIGSNTFNDFRVDNPPQQIYFNNGKTTTVSTFTITSDPDNKTYIGGYDDWSLYCDTGTIELENCELEYSTALGLATFNAYIRDGNVDIGNNSGWNLYSSDRYWVGNTGNWNDANKWAETSNGIGGLVPVPDKTNDVYFDNNSFIARPDDPVLTLNFEGSDGETTWEEEAQELELGWSYNCEIDTDQSYSGASSLLMAGSGSYSNFGYSFPEMTDSYRLTYAIRMSTLPVCSSSQSITCTLDSQDSNPSIEIELSNPGQPNVAVTVSDKEANDIIDTAYLDVANLIDTWYLFNIEVSRERITISINDTELVSASSFNLFAEMSSITFQTYDINCWLDSVSLVNIGSPAGGTVYVDGACYCKSMDWSSVTNNPNLLFYRIPAPMNESCFAFNTPILTETEMIPISELNIGDKILTRNDEGNNELDTISFIKKSINNHYYILNNTIKVTKAHRFFTTQGLKEVKDLEINDLLITNTNTPISLESKEYIEETITVYNLELTKNHNFFVSPDNKIGFLVHNLK